MGDLSFSTSLSCGNFFGIERGDKNERKADVGNVSDESRGDDKTAQECGVNPGDMLHLVLSLRGGR